MITDFKMKLSAWHFVMLYGNWEEKPLLELQRLINLVDSGECHPIDQSLADMSINDKWSIISSLAGNSKIYISNENIP